MFVKLIGGAGSSKAGHAHEKTVESDVLVPTQSQAGFAGESERDTRGQDLVAVRFGLLIEQLAARHAHDSHWDSLASELLLGLDAKHQFGSGANQDRFWGALAIAHDIATFFSAGCTSHLGRIHRRYILSR